jgi:hypothetical protein
MREVIRISAIVMIAVTLTSAYWSVQIPDQQMEAIGQCVPIYYSGLECCK